MNSSYGIDPGLTGGISVIDAFNLTLKIIPIPTVTETFTKNGKKSIRNVYDVPALISKVPYAVQSGIYPDHVFLEHVTARPGEGTTSSFRFGVGFGYLEMLMHCKNYPVTLIRPQTWKKALGLIGADKDVSRLKAIELFPLCSKAWKLKKSNGTAEATLMAWYGILQLGISIDSTKITLVN